MTVPIPKFKRFAVLHALEEGSRPAAIAVDYGDRGVRVDSLEAIHSTMYREPYRVLQRDLSSVEYQPGDREFFDQVLCDLARHYSVGERGEAEVCSWSEHIDLFRRKVIEPDREQQVAAYLPRLRPEAIVAPAATEEERDRDADLGVALVA